MTEMERLWAAMAAYDVAVRASKRLEDVPPALGDGFVVGWPALEAADAELRAALAEVLGV